MRLRGHHLICLNFFRGYGYSRRFVERVRKVVERVERGRIRIVSGPDDICRFCPMLRRCKVSEDLDEMALKLLRVKSGVRWEEVRRRVSKIAPVWRRIACPGCRWYKICWKGKA